MADGTVIDASKPIFLDPSPIEFEIVDIEGPDQVTPGLADRAAALDAHGVDVTVDILEPFGPKNTRIFYNGINIERFDTVNEVDPCREDSYSTTWWFSRVRIFIRWS